MSVHAAPMPLSRPRRRRGRLAAASYIIIGFILCAIIVTALTWRHIERVRQWHPYGGKTPVVTAWHVSTWAGTLAGLGDNRYTLIAGEDPSGSYGEDVPAPQNFGPPYDDLSKIKVTGDRTGITITYASGNRVFLPKSNLKGR